MNSTSSFPSDKQQIPPEEALRTIQSGLEKVDAERGRAYGSLATLRAAKSNQLDRQQSLLARKLGPNHPRVIALQTQSALIKRQLPELRAAQVQAATRAPTVKPAGYGLHGFVRTAERKPLPQIVVAVYDKKGKKRNDFDYATTDANGYFELTTPQLVASTKADPKPGAESPQPVTLQVRLFKSRKPIPHFLPAIDALPGRTDFREVLVDSDTQPSAAPPASVPAKPTAQPASKPGAEPRTALKIIRDGLRKFSQYGSAGTTSATTGQKSKATSRKQQKGRMPQGKKRHPKKGKSH
jgi:hypothetical protein